MAILFTPEEITELQHTFNLSYHVPFAAFCSEHIGFESKSVLEVGGSLPPEFVLTHLKATKWTSLETPEYEKALEETGGITHTGTVIGNHDIAIQRGFQSPGEESYTFIYDNIENLPHSFENQFDLVFSIAAFEHIQKFPESLQKMFSSLKSGGKLFAIFSPIWSARDGHHLPDITDASGKTYSFATSPIPDWGHLLMSPSEMYLYLKNHVDDSCAAQMTYFIYESPFLNRFMTQDYVNFIYNSPFEVEICNVHCPMPINDALQQKLEQRYPHNKHFSNEGLVVILRKP